MTAQHIQISAQAPLPSVELFAGCGAMAYGLAMAGLRAIRIIEESKHAVQTINHNRETAMPELHHEPVEPTDIKNVDWRDFAGKIKILTGGPPCECWGIGGKKKGKSDQRNLWPEVFRAVGETAPEAFLFENVAGMSNASVGHYTKEVCRVLANPTPDLHYHVSSIEINTADYGSSQQRKRLIFVGFRKDLYTGVPPFPPKTHCADALIWDKWVTGEYWRRHNIEPPTPTKQDMKRADALRLAPPPFKAHRTIRDALKGLDNPPLDPSGDSNHVFRDGVRFYKGHTGSELDLPAKALKAGDHGVPGGENAIRFTDGSGRYLTVREAARLQGLPDTFSFPNSWSQNMRQLGNACPAEVAEYFGRWLADHCRARERSATEAVPLHLDPRWSSSSKIN